MREKIRIMEQKTVQKAMRDNFRSPASPIYINIQNSVIRARRGNRE